MMPRGSASRILSKATTPRARSAVPPSSENSDRFLKAKALEFSPDVADNRRLANLCGPLDQNLRQIEEAFHVKLARRGDPFTVLGPAARVLRTLATPTHF